MVTTTTTWTASMDAPYGVREAMTETAVTRTTPNAAPPRTRMATQQNDDSPVSRRDAACDDGRRTATTPRRIKGTVRAKPTTAPRHASEGRRRTATAPTRTNKASTDAPTTVPTPAVTTPTLAVTTTTLAMTTTTPLTTVKPATKSATHKNATNGTAVATTCATTPKTMANDATLMTNDADDLGDDAEANPADDYTLQLSDDEIMMV
ncbi:hypothetical protein ON010_g9215 [Phytophthora cinnamomi]|nr:hypothetical protein ON010_g9215 [Phytophthora cinnamomi]